MSADKEKEADTDSVPECTTPWYRSYRYYLAVICFLGCIHVYAQRVGISVGIVCMVNQTAIRIQNEQNEPPIGNVSLDLNVTAIRNHTKTSHCAMSMLGGDDDESFEDGPFEWDKRVQGHILGAFFYGYLVSQVPGGLLAERYGGKWVLAICIGMSTLATILSPMAARISYIFLILLRVVAGIGSGAVYPSLHAIWSKWAPPQERSKLTNISYAGSWMGNVVAFPLAGILCKYGFDEGWGSIFYVIGISSVVWLLIWSVFVHDSPAKHPRISDAERDYIEKSLGKEKGDDDEDRKKQSVPWLAMLTSRPVWGVIIGAICIDWGLYLFLTQTPTYMYEVLKFDVQSNGFMSALPFIGLWFGMTVSPIIADKLITSKVLGIGKTRKLFHGIGGFGAAGCLVILAFIDCRHPLLAVAILTLGIMINGCHFSGYLVTPMDIAPQYAGTIFGIANGLSAICGFMAPYVVALMTPQQSHAEWQRVFFLTAAVYALGAIVYILLSSGELQSWAKETDKVSAGEQDHMLAVNGDVAANGKLDEGKMEDKVV